MRPLAWLHIMIVADVSLGWDLRTESGERWSRGIQGIQITFRILVRRRKRIAARCFRQPLSENGQAPSGPLVQREAIYAIYWLATRWGWEYDTRQKKRKKKWEKRKEKRSKYRITGFQTFHVSHSSFHVTHPATLQFFSSAGIIDGRVT